MWYKYQDHYSSEIWDSKMFNQKDCGYIQCDWIRSGRKVATCRKKVLHSSAGMTEAEGPFVNWYIILILIIFNISNIDKEVNKEIPENDLIEDRNMLEWFLKCFKWF
jgi:hypothetical protein